MPQDIQTWLTVVMQGGGTVMIAFLVWHVPGFVKLFVESREKIADLNARERQQDREMQERQSAAERASRELADERDREARHDMVNKLQGMFLETHQAFQDLFAKQSEEFQRRNERLADVIDGVKTAMLAVKDAMTGLCKYAECGFRHENHAKQASG